MSATVTRPLSPRTLQVRALNDTLRRHYIGGRTLITSGINALSADDREVILWAVRKFDAFDANCDPHGEHDFGKVDIRGYVVFFKIDGGDAGLVSDEPSSRHRVLTIMLAEEY